MRGDKEQIVEIPRAPLSGGCEGNCCKQEEPGHGRGHWQGFLWPVSRSDTDLHTHSRGPPIRIHIRPTEEAKREIKTQLMQEKTRWQEYV